MAITQAMQTGNLDGTNAVDILDAPASGARRITRAIIITNLDTVPVDFTLYRDKNGTDHTIVLGVSITTGRSFIIEIPFVLSATDEKLQGVLAAVKTTTNPTFTVSYAEES